MTVAEIRIGRGLSGRMSPQAFHKIASNLHDWFDDHIDMVDKCRHPPDKSEEAFLSRGLAALAVQNLSGCSDAEAGASITDGHRDGGLDAIFLDHKNSQLIIVQSKWTHTNNDIEYPKVVSFTDGVRRAIDVNVTHYNQKVQSKKPELVAAQKGMQIRTVLVLIQNAPKIPDDSKNKLKSFVDELNLPGAEPMAFGKCFAFKEVMDAIQARLDPPSIDLTIDLSEWGYVASPYRAFYGQVSLEDAAGWWRKWRGQLCSSNIRTLIQDSIINQALTSTIAAEPSHFWYFNNGITIVCEKFSKVPMNTQRKVGQVSCKGASIVNGAQTIGTIGESASVNDLAQSDINELPTPIGWVQVRIIEVPTKNSRFHELVTRATNHQNRIGAVDFASMDPNQHRLFREFALDRRTYAYKTGMVEPHGSAGCSMIEAAQALACAHRDVGFAVQCKRELSGLYANTSEPPYTALFTSKVTADHVWQAVNVMRVVDEELIGLQDLDAPRAEQVAIHLNRLILHVVFRSIPRLKSQPTPDDLEKVRRNAKSKVRGLFLAVCEEVQSDYHGDILATLAKNRGKCEAIVASVTRSSVKGPEQGFLDYGPL